MDLEPSRLRRGEWIAGVSGLLLLAFMFLVPWYGVNSVIGPTAATLHLSTTFDGWNSLTNLRWLMLVSALVALALAYFQATRRGPAIPVSLSVIVTVLGVITVLFLIYRVLINVPGSDSVIDRKAGAYLGLLSAIGIMYGGYASMRQEGIAASDGPGEIPTVTPQGAPGS
jgi:Mn2+/Fe2+ NRAMP family transporter